jgi:hypothetical protein
VKIVKNFALIFVVTMLSVTGCKAKKLTSDQLEGVWRIESSDISAPKPKGVSVSTKLALNHDGKFFATSLPSGICQIKELRPDQGISGSGTWNFTEDHRLSLDFTKIDGYAGEHLPYGAELFIQRSGADLQLLYFEGDPDESQFISFRRE